MEILKGILEQGMIYSIMALGVYITYKILDFPDLTVDGSFPLGAAVTVFLMKNTGLNPFIITFMAMLSGAAAGFVTGAMNVKFGVRNLLSGIITMTGLYSINLRIAGSANVPIFNMNTIFSVLPIDRIYVVLLITVLSKVILDLYFNTEMGYLLKAVGDNHVLVTSLGKNSGNVKILGLAIGNALVALSGSVMMQQQGFFEISMGTGAMVLSLASVIIGTNLFKRIRKIKDTTSVISGSIIYRGCVSLAMTFNFASASDLKLITSILFFVILVVGKERTHGKIIKIKEFAKIP